MTYSNPFETTLPGDSAYSFSAMANAAWHQRVTVLLDGVPAAVFNGRGEGVAMTTEGGATRYDGAVRGNTRVALLFQFSSDGAVYRDAVVAEALATPVTVMVGSEDSGDGDNNDTVLTLTIAPL